MKISLDLLITYGASIKKYQKGETIFREGNMPHYFYQIVEGSVKVFCMNNKGKELIQGIFKAGESFGEPPLLVNRPYPSSARAIIDSTIVRLAKDKFLKLLDSCPEIATTLLNIFASRIYDKASIVQILVCHTPEEKIVACLNKFKQDNNIKTVNLIPYTRQQIADLTGLRVETVIRTLIKLSKSKKVQIIDHKIYY